VVKSVGKTADRKQFTDENWRLRIMFLSLHVAQFAFSKQLRHATLAKNRTNYPGT
jgi:hypothetical protein